MGGGGKGGGGGHTPIEKPNTLESAQRLKIIDLLCEGVAGQDVTFKNIYLDNTPIQNADGSYNFTGIRVSALPGTHNQDYLAGFDSTDKIVAVGAEVKAATPITRTITDPLVDSVRVTLALGSLVTMTDKGDRVGGSVSLTVVCGNKSYPVTISGKTTSAYHQDVVLTDLPDAPFNISVHRNTPDSTTDKVSNETHWVSYVESIDAKFNYPNSVVVGLEIDSAQFGGKIPTRTYRNKWTQVKVPNNYDPITRTYEGIWLGEFKTAWSDNPAWVFYDLVTDKRYGLGDRLGEFGCDKWSLYQIAKYCDQIVPDGFGGQEPRFTCNAYLSEPRDAKALLDDLASVFRGIAVWDGEMVTALQDAKKDPTATYSNANVVDGMFAYSGAAQKTIFTAVHVKYNDKTDNFATKTEYVANDEAIKRYGLNVKQITAFACTSRGQAARVGKGLIETSIRERQMVSFSVGREGIRHLPFDIIEIADNDYAGDMIGGRVLSVTGNIITVDRPMSAINSIRYYANGQSKTINVTAVQDDKITLSDTPVGIEQLGVFSATKTDVKPRLFRALSIAEDDGTYTISAVQHDENKEAVVDQGITFEQDSTATKHKPQVSYGRVSKDGDELVISWEGTNTTQYLIKIYKDGKLYNSYTQDTAEIKLKGLSNGNYRAEIRGKSANGELTEAVIKEWSIDYDIKGLKATPELFAIKLDWTNPTTVINKAKIEIYRSQTADRATASKVATLSYPTDTFTQNGVKLTETHHFWLRLIDDQGNTGNWVTVSGQCSSDTSQIVASINGQITETELAQSLIDSLQSDIDTAKNQAIGSAATDAANKVAAEAQARQKALAAQDKKQTDALINKANELGTQISEVSDANDQQAQQLTTITAKQGELVSGLEVERTARIAGDAAEATARQTLASQVGGNKTSITDLQSTKASKTEVSSLARTALQSEWQSAANTAKNQAVTASQASIDNLSQTVADNKKSVSQTEDELRAEIKNAIGDNLIIKGVNTEFGYINASTGELFLTGTANRVQDFVMIDFIQVKKGERYEATINPLVDKVTDIAPNIYVHFYDNSKNWISAQSVSGIDKEVVSFDYVAANDGFIKIVARGYYAHNHKLAKVSDSLANAYANINTVQQAIATNENTIAQTKETLEAGLKDVAGYNLIDKGQNTSYGYINASTGQIVVQSSLGGHQDFISDWIAVKKGESFTASLYPIKGKPNSIYPNIYIHYFNSNKNWLGSAYANGGDDGIVINNYIAENDGYIRTVMRGYSDYSHRLERDSDSVKSTRASITTLQNTVVTKNQAQSTHTIKTQAIAGGKRALAGIAVGAMANETTAESQVIVMADKFGVVKDAGDSNVKPMLTVVNNQVAVNGDLIADGTILGKHIKANQTLTAPVINGGSLNINNRFKVDRFGNTTIQTSAGNVGLKITDEKIEVYDDSGQIRVRLGVW
ncbi:MAG: phage tail protein [Psychrobacter sp.]|uniref:TipJ family phage tail tip protein n=1 Tax=Psychrobacter sp. TaxID=56811 RepID=UPI002649573E|nr:phage tail protein [Psychrobacter sp.]MDN5619225.1 phage tail protein [Psychrobacter sp.]